MVGVVCVWCCCCCEVVGIGDGMVNGCYVEWQGSVGLWDCYISNWQIEMYFDGKVGLDWCWICGNCGDIV